jgi:hypothetical protein
MVSEAEVLPVDEMPCPVCSSPKKLINASVGAQIELRDELDGTASNRQGLITAERISRTDGNTSATLAADLDQPAQIMTVRERRIEGFDEEGVVAEDLAKARNAKRRTRYMVKPKDEEDSGYADRELVSSVDEPKLIEVQMRHFDTEIVARINPRKNSEKPGEFKGKRDVDDLAEGVEKAIAAKAKVDPVTKAKAILLVLTPATIGKMARKELQRRSFDLKGFMEVWVAPFREEVFEVYPPLDHDRIEAEAFSLWENEVPLTWSDDQRFWYAAIDKLRGL